MRRIPSWLILIFLFAFVYACGVFGLKGHQSWTEFRQSPDLADKLYSIIQLFVLEGRAVTDLPANAPISPIPLWFAAYTAPIVTIFAFLQLVWRDVTNAVSGVFHRYLYRNHTVIVGFGWRGQRFAASALARGKRIAAIDTHEPHEPASAPDVRNFRFFAGDARSGDVLLRAGAHRAAQIVIFCGDEFSNIELARRVSLIVGQRVKSSDRYPRIICHSNSSVQRDQLIADQTMGGLETPIVEFYSPAEAAARQCVRAYSPLRSAKLKGLETPHTLIFGDGPLVKKLIRHITITSQGEEPTRPRFTILTEKLSPADPFFQTASDAFDLTLIPVDLRDVASWKDHVLGTTEQVSQYIIASAGEMAPKDLALSLHRIVAGLPGHDAPIVFGPDRFSSDGDDTPDKRPSATSLVSSFGDDPDVLSWNQVVAQQQDGLARTNHQAYLEELNRKGERTNPIAKPAFRPWAELSEPYRASNRSFVDHLPTKLDLLGCSLADQTVGIPAPLEKSDQETLAKAEHNRWMAERRLSGWHHGATRNDLEKRHPDLVPWNDLPKDLQTYDLALVGALPELVARTQKRIAPVVSIGVTGHRHSSINPSNRQLTRAIDAVLDAIRAENPDAIFAMYSPLAEGADRLVVKRAMTRLSARLIVPLPFQLSHYRQDFIHKDGEDAAQRSQASLAEFQSFIDGAEEVFELPAMLRSDAQNYRTQHYSALGAWLVRSCDHLIGIWDGEPAAGPGGTAEVISWAQGTPIPEEIDHPQAGAVSAKVHIIPFDRRAST